MQILEKNVFHLFILISSFYDFHESFMYLLISHNNKQILHHTYCIVHTLDMYQGGGAGAGGGGTGGAAGGGAAGRGAGGAGGKYLLHYFTINTFCLLMRLFHIFALICQSQSCKFVNSNLIGSFRFLSLTEFKCLFSKC